MRIDFFLAYTILSLLFTLVESNHFLGGTITWRVSNSSSNSSMVSVLLTQTYSWTYVSGRCDGNAIATNQLVSGTAGFLTCSPSCPSGFGSVSTSPYCTDVSPLNGIAVGQRTDTVTIPVNSNFSAMYSGLSWGTLTSGGLFWSVLTMINLNRRLDTGDFNNAPVATVMSPININPNQRKLIEIPVQDADGDIVRCRWAGSGGNTQECASACPPGSLPPNTTLHSNCTIEVTGTTAGSTYAVAVMLEDFANASSLTPFSSIPVQLIVSVVASPACSLVPEIIPWMQSCTPVTVNQTFTSDIFAINNCGPTVSIIDIATLSFSGMNKSSVQQINSTLYYKNLVWTPTMAQIGYQLMCVMALDSQYAQSDQYCLTFYVSANATNPCSPTTSTTSTTTTTTTTTTATSTTTLSDSKVTPDWIVIGTLSGLAASFAFLCTLCLLRHLVKKAKRRRKRRTNHKDSQNMPIATFGFDQASLDLKLNDPLCRIPELDEIPSIGCHERNLDKSDKYSGKNQFDPFHKRIEPLSDDHFHSTMLNESDKRLDSPINMNIRISQVTLQSRQNSTSKSNSSSFTVSNKNTNKQHSLKSQLLTLNSPLFFNNHEDRSRLTGSKSLIGETRLRKNRSSENLKSLNKTKTDSSHCKIRSKSSHVTVELIKRTAIVKF